jgi:hypothetical protein
MAMLFRYALLGFFVSAALAITACGNHNKKVSDTQNTTLANKTTLYVLSKNNSDKNDTIQVTIASEDGPKSLLGYIDVDGPGSETNALTPTNFEAAVGEISKSTMDNGDVTILVKYYLDEKDTKPLLAIFSAKTLLAANEKDNSLGFDEKSVQLIKDQTYLPQLNLEENTGFSTDDIIEQLKIWLAQYGISGVDTFANSYSDNDGN